LEKDDPYVLYFCSSFSLSEWDESNEDYDNRYVDYLTKAAEGNVAEAMCRLSSLYFTGEIVAVNIEIGKGYLDRAMELNLGLAKLLVGVNAYYGSNCYPKDIEKAVELVSEAARDNVEDAFEVLEKIKASI
jgi:TPR repeat protein